MMETETLFNSFIKLHYMNVEYQHLNAHIYLLTKPVVLSLFYCEEPLRLRDIELT